MQDYRKRRTKAEVVLHLFWVCAGLLVLGFLAIASLLGAWRMYQRLAAATDAENASKAQLALVSAQEAQVQSDIAELDTPRGQEAALRERYGVAKPGEGVIQVVHTTQATSTGDSSQGGNWLIRIFRTLFVW